MDTFAHHLSRRGFMSWVGGGLASASLASLLTRDALAEHAESPTGSPHFAPRAKRAIHICLVGPLSQVDSFDYKPELARMHGKSLVASEKPDVFFGQVGLLRQSDWAFHRRGQTGLWVSDLFPHLARRADELCVINSMVAETSNHTPAGFQQNTGFRLNGFPALGSWLSYGLGSESENLPAFVVIPDARELPAGGAINWNNGFLPARHQGVVMRAGGAGPAVDDLFPARPVAPGADSAARDLLAGMNRRHLADRHGADPGGALTARIRSYELAARMQLAVPEVTDLAGESESTREMYGLNGAETADFGRACLLARRLAERGVRFVQLFSGGTFGSPRRNWDGHEDMVKNHAQEALRIDQPVAALLTDLRQRGMLDDTLVLFTTEFGRTPFTQSAANVVGKGRDHNQYGFSVWLAGGGSKPGTAYGATDDVGWKSVVNPTPWHDFHATVLHLLGIDHERLTYYHNGIRRRLTNVHGEVVKGIVA
ncbi:MAG TPA: DUF1501 domain-containing protein [Tepidisphaeraceae bacterium]|nr:DUF1501 domain-containing protein [Tepidisphaeraceae bacterium]